MAVKEIFCYCRKIPVDLSGPRIKKMDFVRCNACQRVFSDERCL